jgi:glutathione S-transferase
MSSTYILYGSPRSRSSRIAWVLEELGVDWQWRAISFRAGEHRSPEFLAMNPGAKVPVLQHGDFALTESAAIGRYLAAQHPEAGLLPAEGTTEAALVDRWLFFVTTELEQALWTKAKHTFALPAKLRVEAVRKTAEAEFRRAAAVADTMFGSGSHAVGDTFTLADIFLAHTCSWARAGRQWDSLSPTLQAYAKTQLARPAWQRAVQLESGA